MVDEQGRGPTQVHEAGCIQAAHFFDFYDEEFLVEVYKMLLGRAPDPSGLAAYMPLIRSGETRYLVLDAISRSPEAGAIGVRVFGMKPYRRMRSLRRIPVIGRLVDAAVLLWNAREIMRDLRALENHIYRVSKTSEL